MDSSQLNSLQTLMTGAILKASDFLQIKKKKILFYQN